MVKNVIFRRLSVIIVLAGFFGLLACASLDESITTATAETLAQPLAEPLTEPAAANPGDSAQASTSSQVYLPLTAANYPWRSPFGVESNKDWFPGTTIFQRGVNLGIQWARMGNWRISWRTLQPNEGDPIDWGKMADFEKELRALKANGISPVLIISDSPRWATTVPTSCGPVREDKFNAYADFVRALVNRYKTDEFNVHDWELGNEPDVDPVLVKVDSVFGCWGDIDDPYYGGEHYGEMVKVVGKTIKESDPAARVWIGGLLLATPNTVDPNLGHPELFLAGILNSGAAPYFDVVPYHWYPPYLNQQIDHDLKAGPWEGWGGGTLGKARFLRQIMGASGVNKPLVLNETSLMCPPTVGGNPVGYCSPPTSAFYQMQANHLVRSFVRGLSENLSGYVWYTLNGPGWRFTGLLTAADDPRPSYITYQVLVDQLHKARFKGTFNYGSGIEAYVFSKGNEQVHVVWTINPQSLKAVVHKSKFIAAYAREGTQLSPPLVGDRYEIEVGFKPVYIVRKP